MWNTPGSRKNGGLTEGLTTPTSKMSWCAATLKEKCLSAAVKAVVADVEELDKV
jgi:hypothetical protein